MNLNHHIISVNTTTYQEPFLLIRDHHIDLSPHHLHIQKHYQLKSLNKMLNLGLLMTYQINF
jgi:hypothetical protein